MEKMEEWEIHHFVDNLVFVDKNEWEKTRMLMYIMAQINSTKKLKISDIMKFPWDDCNENVDHSISDEDIKRLSEKAKKIEEELNNGRK